MKENKNNLVTRPYYIGLDAGTSSVGWAVTDENYNVLKFKGNGMWGVRLFDEADTSAGRRQHRTARRRLNRQKQRLLILQTLFAEEIAKVDPDFFQRMHESGLLVNDKTDSKFTVFADNNYTDREYHKLYPTVYHLRSELVQSRQPHDVRLVFLAIHHIFKSRGHFLYETADNEEYVTLESAFGDLVTFLVDQYETNFVIRNRTEYLDILQRKDLGVTAKKKALRELLVLDDSDSSSCSVTAISDMLAGATIKLSDLFCDESLKEAEIKSFCLKANLDESFDVLSACLDERVELLVSLKNVYDAAILLQILGEHGSISRAKIALYDKNRRDLFLLKNYVRSVAPEKYKLILSQKSSHVNNFAAYSGYKNQSGDYSCSQADFCKFLRKELPMAESLDEEMSRIFREISDNSFLTKLRSSENGVIPYQLHKRELLDIINNASYYLSFLNETDPDGISVKEKIIKTFEFRIPYYVGPLHTSSHPNHWAVRFAGKETNRVYPWNFETIIDKKASADMFIGKLVGLCTYTGDRVLPKNSLLYSEFMMLNEMNLLRVNGHSLPQDVKQALLQHFFYDSCKKVTKKQIHNYLLAQGFITDMDEISGIDDTIKSSLRSYHDFRDILKRTGDVSMVEDIIRSIMVFSSDKVMLRHWLEENTHGLTPDDISHICRLKYTDWGRLSKTLLDGIVCPNKMGEDKTVIQMLAETDMNLIQIMSSEYGFAAAAAEHRDELFGCNQSLSVRLDSMYIAPSVRRSLRQALRIVDEIVDIQKGAPSKIFIEMARGSKIDLKNKRTESRKSKLVHLYQNCVKDSVSISESLDREDALKLRSDKLYLYYLQMGKCMYSGEDIDLESLLRGEKYDIDHIFPRSRIKDNSLDNRVLVKNELNREKTNIYPISDSIRLKMQPTWAYMKKAGLISQKKYDRLIRSYPLTEAELSDFVARQLTETQQSTKTLATLLKDFYPETRIVYSKAGNVSDFRHQFDLVKCREINDLHHAKDAYLNIVVGNVYATKFTDLFFANIHREKYSLNRVFDFDTPGAWDHQESIKLVKRFMSKNNILVTRLPRAVQGELFDLQVVPAGKGQLPKKTALPIDQYGGYKNLTGTWFCVVEYTEKKKRVRAFQPVYLYAKDLFERDPILYFETILHLASPKIIVPKVRMDSLLELDGQRLYVSGRSNNRLRCQHTYQLVMDSAHEKYIRAISKYVDRCLAQRTELPVSAYDGICVIQNEDLYRWFIEKCNQSVYSSFLANMKADMIANCEKFVGMSLFEQCKLLLEIIKAFRCNAQVPNFSSLCGKSEVAAIFRGINLTKYSSAFIVNQSVTGLYESKIDLLR